VAAADIAREAGLRRTEAEPQQICRLKY